MRQPELTFEAVDDLVSAHARGRLYRAQPETRFSPSAIGPLIELSFESTNGRYGPLLVSAWLDHITQTDLRIALTGSNNIWLDRARRRGFMRTVFNPLDAQNDVPRTSFLLAARIAAGESGLPAPIALTLAAALRELESNIYEHSERPESGIIAFQSRPSSFEFLAADGGVGVLATLREAPQFHELSDHGRAIHLALQPNVSRHGRGPDHGNGFSDLFLWLAGLNADLRFRSGDHALTISGIRPDIKMAHLAQKSNFPGFLASVRCRPFASSAAAH